MIAGLILVVLALSGTGPVLVQPFIVWENPFFATSVSMGPNAIYAAGGNQVRRYELNGTVTWTVDVDAFVAGLSAVPNGVYVVGYAPNSNYKGTGFEQRNATLARLDSNGGLVWSRQLTTSSDADTSSWASAVTADSAGIYVAGYTTLFNRYPLNGWVAKIDFDGDQLWVKNVGPIGITSAISSGPKTVYVSGHSKGCLGYDDADVCPVEAYVTAIKPDGQTVWTSELPAYCGPTSHSSSCDYQGAPQTFASGISVGVSGVYVSGFTEGVFPGQAATSSGRGASDAFMAKYDLNGTAEWFRQFGTAFQNSGYGISTSPSGTFVVASDGLRLFDSSGNQTWLFKPDFTARSISTAARSIILGGYTTIAEVCATRSCQ